MATEIKGLAAKLGVKVGDHFAAIWGYDQTNVDFFEVVAITPSGASVKVLPVAKQITKSSGGAEYVVPVPGSHRDWSRLRVNDADDVGKPMTKRLKDVGWNGEHEAAFHYASYADAYKWEGKPLYQTAAGWGH